jgi:hypothetical protein
VVPAAARDDIRQWGRSECDRGGAGGIENLGCVGRELTFAYRKKDGGFVGLVRVPWFNASTKVESEGGCLLLREI